MRTSSVAMSVAVSVSAALASVSLSAPATAAPASAPAPEKVTTVSSPLPAASARAASSAPLAYWTPQRMAKATAASTPAEAAKSRRSAQQADPNGPAMRVAGVAGPGAPKQAAKPHASVGSRWYGSQYSAPATTTGKLFFRDLGNPANPSDDRDSYCSASAVNSEAKNLVFTAGHCVHGGRGGTWHARTVFVPDYNAGSRPYGTWVSRQQSTFSSWVSSSDQRWDIGALTVFPNASGSRLVNVVGGQGIEWNRAAEQYTYAFGYPGNKDGGERLNYCSNTTFKDGWWIFWTGMIGLDCDMTYGSSGGPWLAGFNGSIGYLHSVVHGGNPAVPKFFGAYFDTNVGTFYNGLRYRY